MTCRAAPLAVLLLVLAAACARAPAGAPDAAVSAPPVKTPDPGPPLGRDGPALEHLGGMTLAPARVWVAQVKATPDEAEAAALARALRSAGVLATLHRADLGPKGLWFRVGVGEWPRKDLLEARAPELLASKAVGSVLGPPPPGEPAFLPLEVPRLRDPGEPLAKALAALVPSPADGGAPGPDGPEAFLVPGTDGAVRAVVAGLPDGKVHVLNAQGATVASFPVPVADGPECRDAAGTPHVLLAWDLAGREDLEVLLTVGAPRHRALVVVAAGPQGYVPVLSVPVDMELESGHVVADVVLKQLDEDPDLELLLAGAALGFEGGLLCSATPVERAYDLEPGPRVRAMDERLHGANGVARHQGGAAEIRTFLKGTWERTPVLALDAALAYLAEAPDDAEIYRDVVAHAEAAGRDGRRGLQLQALVGLVAARGEWRAGLAPRLHDVLPLAVKETEVLRRHSCADNPLLMGLAAQKAHADPREALALAWRRRDVGQLPVGALAALLDAYPQGSPLAEDVRAMMELLDQTVPALAAQARVLATARRGGTAAASPSIPVPARVPEAAAPAPREERP